MIMAIGAQSDNHSEFSSSLHMLEKLRSNYEDLSALKRDEKIAVSSDGSQFTYGVLENPLPRTLLSCVFSGRSKTDALDFVKSLNDWTFTNINNLSVQSEDLFACEQWSETDKISKDIQVASIAQKALSELSEHLSKAQSGIRALSETYRNTSETSRAFEAENERIDQLITKIQTTKEKLERRKYQFKGQIDKVQKTVIQKLHPVRCSAAARGGFAFAAKSRPCSLDEQIPLQKIDGYTDNLIHDRGLQSKIAPTNNPELLLPKLLLKDLPRQKCRINGVELSRAPKPIEQMQALFQKLVDFAGGDTKKAQFYAKFFTQLSTVELMLGVVNTFQNPNLGLRILQLEPSDRDKKNTEISLDIDEGSQSPILKVSTYFSLYQGTKVLGTIKGSMKCNLNSKQAMIFCSDLSPLQEPGEKEERESLIHCFNEMYSKANQALEETQSDDSCGAAALNSKIEENSFQGNHGILPSFISKVMNTCYVLNPFESFKDLSFDDFKENDILYRAYRKIRKNERFDTSCLQGVDTLHGSKGLGIKYAQGSYTWGTLSIDAEERKKVFTDIIKQWQAGTDKYLAFPIVIGSSIRSHVTLAFLERGINKIEFFDSKAINPSQSYFKSSDVSIQDFLNSLKDAIEEQSKEKEICEIETVLEDGSLVQLDLYNCGAYVSKYCELRATGKCSKETVRLMPGHEGIMEYRKDLMRGIAGLVNQQAEVQET